MQTWILTLIVGVLLGLGLSFFGMRWSRRRERRWAEEEAAELVENARKDAQALDEELKLEFAERREEAFEKFERDTRKITIRNAEFDEDLTERERRHRESVQTREQLLNRKSQSLGSRKQKVEAYQSRVQILRDKAGELRGALVSEARKRSSVSEEDLRAQIHSKMEAQARTLAMRKAQEVEQEAQLNTERDAKKIINVTLNRFARPYCSERGIGNITFNNPDHKLKVFGQNDQNIRQIEKLCGVDVVYNADYLSATVMGFDPVRRELGRLVLDQVAKQKNIHERVIDDIFNRAKKDLFKKILTDGNRVANELRLNGLHENVRSMLGALRYRYSFAQNQHFHVAEVGWLCGMLSSELGLAVEHGRRSGLLHDIGKAMDHSKDGGHAVIGAEFIEGHGEVAEVVHAVRAHHYDETPATDLAFLTIAADALSGARPGARRSTMDSYTQKMADLEKISSSFYGVTATYILSAGREVRVIVDGHKIDDHKALKLSKEMAQKIEEELSYPGLIKVTVVRETLAVDFAR